MCRKKSSWKWQVVNKSIFFCCKKYIKDNCHIYSFNFEARVLWNYSGIGCDLLANVAYISEKPAAIAYTVQLAHNRRSAV